MTYPHKEITRLFVTDDVRIAVHTAAFVQIVL